MLCKVSVKQKDQKKETLDKKKIYYYYVFGSLETELIPEKVHWKVFCGPRSLDFDF